MAEQTPTPQEIQERFWRSVRAIFAGPDGEVVLKELRRSASHGNAVFYAGQPDKVAFMLGRQDVVNKIHNIVTMTDLELQRAFARLAPVQTDAEDGDPMWGSPISDG